jgi:peptidoglycan hydrolase-like protein with peptidoglycan-binding domain
VHSRPEETKPPVGQDLVFSVAQIRYCLAEDIRMEGAKSALNNYSGPDVDRFNAMVSDYNSRCGSFRYRKGALEGARSDIEQYRSKLQAEGRNRFDRSGSLSTPTPSLPAPDATIQTIQLKLNELGYDAGTPDGLMGRDTRSAIIAFQKDRRLAVTGVASEALMLQIQQSPEESNSGPGTEESVAQDPLSRSTTTETGPTASSPPPTFAAPPTKPLPQAPITEDSILSGINSTERAAIENACGYHKRNSGPADYYDCLRRELASLSNSAGRPDISRATASEQTAIENACGYHKRNSGPGDYYGCLRRELANLSKSSGRPDLSRATASEQSAIENACGYHKRNSGPGDYYSCLRRELATLANSAGQPDLSRANPAERSSIENACGYHKRNSGPGDYYNCLRREMASLVNSGGPPDLSRVDPSEQAAIQNACGYHRRNSGPGDYYRCLRGEFSKLAYR